MPTNKKTQNIKCNICGKDIDHGGQKLSVKAIHKDGKFQTRQKTKGNINICDNCMFELFCIEIPLFTDKGPDSNLIDIEYVMPLTKLLKYNNYYQRKRRKHV